LLFCQTEVAAKRLRELYGGEFRIALCPNQISIHAGHQEPDIAIPETLLNYRDRFKLFSLTHYYAHKNLEIIPKLFEMHRGPLQDVVVILTISRNEHPGASKLLKYIEKKQLNKFIVTVGPLGQEQIASYYQHTDALFLPTLLESYSGTYVEAMNFRRPILTSDLDFAHNVCGNAALYFNPWDTSDICRAVLELKDKPDLRQKLVENGEVCRQEKSLSWDEIGLGVIRELESLVFDNR